MKDINLIILQSWIKSLSSSGGMILYIFLSSGEFAESRNSENRAWSLELKYKEINLIFLIKGTYLSHKYFLTSNIVSECTENILKDVDHLSNECCYGAPNWCKKRCDFNIDGAQNIDEATRRKFAYSHEDNDKLHFAYRCTVFVKLEYRANPISVKQASGTALRLECDWGGLTECKQRLHRNANTQWWWGTFGELYHVFFLYNEHDIDLHNSWMFSQLLKCLLILIDFEMNFTTRKPFSNLTMKMHLNHSYPLW